MNAPIPAPDNDPFALARATIRDLGLVTAAKQRIVSPNGQEQSWLIDMRPVLLNGPALEAIVQLAWKKLPESPFQLCGLEMASIPLLAGLVLEGARRGRPISAFIVRRERKDSGLGRDVEGVITDAPIVAIDDITNSSDSLEKVRVVLEQHGRSIDRALVVVDFHSGRSIAWRTKHKIAVDSLFRLEDFGLKQSKAGASTRPAYRYLPQWFSEARDPNWFMVAPRSRPACNGDALFVGTDSGELRAIDARTGRVNWSFQAKGAGRKGIWSSPALCDGRLYFGAYNGALYCLSCETGQQIWRADEADWIGSSPVVARKANLVIVGLEHDLASRRGSVAAFDLATGTLQWEHVVTEFIHCTPALSGDESRVVIGTNGGELICLDTATGSLLWCYRADGPIKSAPTLSDSHGLVAAGSFDECLHVVRLSTGQVHAVIKTDGPIYSSALILGDTAYIGSYDKHLYAVDLATGKISRRFALGAKVFAPPVLIGGRIFVGTTGGVLFGIDPATLAITERLQLPERIFNSPVYIDSLELLVVPTFGNRLHAYRLEKVAAPTAIAEAPKMLAPPTNNFDLEMVFARPEGAYYRMPEKIGPVQSPMHSQLPSRRLFGALCLLLMRSKRWDGWTLAEIERQFLPPAILNQTRMFLCGLQPIGAITWGRLSKTAEEKLLAGGRLLDLADWASGDRPWIVDIIAPFGGGEIMLEKVQREVFASCAANVLPGQLEQSR